MTNDAPPRDLVTVEHEFIERTSDAEFVALRNKWETAERLAPGAKFLRDPRQWLEVNLGRVRWADLHVGTRRRVLDIGCGAGYFLFLCQRLGHTAVGIDVDESPIYRDTIRLLGVSRTTIQVRRFESLPIIGADFDVITAHAICFNGHGTGRVWERDEWRFFLDDLRRHAASNAHVFLMFNREPDATFLSPDLRHFFENDLAAGVSADGSSVHLCYGLSRDALRIASTRS